MTAGNLSDNNYVLYPEQWVARYADTLYCYVSNRISDSAAAEDLVQETLLSAWKGRETYTATASEKNWLLAICKNKITDYYRKCAREVSKSFSDFGDANEYFEQSGEWIDTRRPTKWQALPVQPIETKEFYLVLESCKKKLQELQQAVFVLKYIDDMNSDEICKELAISSSNYWVLMHRAKLQLRACLEKNWFATK